MAQGLPGIEIDYTLLKIPKRVQALSKPIGLTGAVFAVGFMRPPVRERANTPTV